MSSRATSEHVRALVQRLTHPAGCGGRTCTCDGPGKEFRLGLCSPESLQVFAELHGILETCQYSKEFCTDELCKDVRQFTGQLLAGASTGDGKQRCGCMFQQDMPQCQWCDFSSFSYFSWCLTADLLFPCCSGLLESHLRLRRCCKCQVARYCSRECQVNDWPGHRAWCGKYRMGSTAVGE